MDVAGVDALAGQRGRRQQVRGDQRLGLAERLPGLERLLAEALAAQLLEAVAHGALPGGLGDGGEALVAQPAADQGAAADDLGGAARGRPAQRAARAATAGRSPGRRSVRRAAGCAGPRAPSRGCSSACRGAPACATSQLRESLSPPWKSRLIAVWAVLAVEPCVPRSTALRRRRAANGSVSPAPSRICVYVPPTSRPPWSSEPATGADGGCRGLAPVLLGQARDERRARRRRAPR